MANGYFERGEIYWIRMDTGFGCEQGIGRPGVILSTNKLNNAAGQVTVAFLTKQEQHTWSTSVEATGVTSWVRCSQVNTFDKTRIGKFLGVLNSAEMRAVEDILEDVFELGYTDDAALKEKETEIRALNVQMDELRAEIEKLKAEIAAHADADVATKVEIEMWQRLYGKALDQVVSMKLDGDIVRRVVRNPEPPVEQPKVEKKTEPPKEPEQTDALVDVNSASFKQLKSCGFSNNLVLTIIDKRPYKTIEDVKKLPGVTNVMWQIVSKKICCVPVPVVVEEPVSEVKGEPVVVEKPEVEEPAKVNVNKCTVSDLTAIGITKWHADRIVKRRDKFGDFEKLEDITNIDKITPAWLSMYRDKLEV